MVVNPGQQRTDQARAAAVLGDQRAEAGVAAGAPVRQSSLWRDAWRRYIRNRGAVIAGIVFGIIVLFCVFVPIISPYDPNAVDFAIANQNPSWDHPFGTDNFGRDLMTRAALGGRISIGIGFVGTLVILAIGIAYGATSGFIGGKLDNGMMRFLDALYGLPYLPFAIITLAIFGRVSFWTMVVSLSIASWFTTARIVRGQILTLKENDYVRAARSIGARWYRILTRHLLPNTLGVLIIAVFLELPSVVLGEAFLSFIGLGINPPDASWGSMAQEGRETYRSYPVQMIVPGAAITTIVLCAFFVADGLRDALDPRTRET
jgi:oligopeptide transport system permease protein